MSKENKKGGVGQTGKSDELGLLRKITRLNKSPNVREKPRNGDS